MKKIIYPLSIYGGTMAFKETMDRLKKSRQEEVKAQSRKKFVIGAGIGVAVGAAAGILLAPRSGRETREKLFAQARDVAEIMKESMDETKKAVDEQKERISKATSQYIEAIRDTEEEDGKKKASKG